MVQRLVEFIEALKERGGGSFQSITDGIDAGTACGSDQPYGVAELAKLRLS